MFIRFLLLLLLSLLFFNEKIRTTSVLEGKSIMKTINILVKVQSCKWFTLTPFPFTILYISANSEVH